MNLGLISLILMAMIILAAVFTKRCTASLLVGSIIGAVFLYGKDFIIVWTEKLIKVVAENAWLWLVCGFFGILIFLMRISRGTLGFSKTIEKLCKTQKSSMLAAFFLGILIFIDDYLNVLTIGVCMKDLFDKRKLPREVLAFLLDSTGAPICVLLPFSSWAAFYSMLFMDYEVVSDKFESPFSAYTAAIPFMFYPLIAILIVFLFCIGKFHKLGAMKRAYERVEKTGMVYSERSRKYNYDVQNSADIKDCSIYDFIIPLAILIVVCIITGEILDGLVVSLIISVIMFLIRKKISADQFLEASIAGFSDMMSIFFLLVACFICQKITNEMGMVDFIITIIKPILTPKLLPMIAFILIAILAFATGSDWGMSAMAIPVFIPLAASTGANIVLTMAAIVSGGTFGSHACFYADATVLSSKSACIDNLDHAFSQLPYVLIAAGLSLICFAVFGFVMD